MTMHVVRRRDRDSLARFLGWFSVGLGTAQLGAPRMMCRLVGAGDSGRGFAVMRALGARELVQGLGILVRPRPTRWMWSRVIGDALDLSLLGLVLVTGRHRGRTILALANVAAVTAPDVFEARHLSRLEGQPRSAMRIKKAVTIGKSRDEVEAAWTRAVELRQKVDAAQADVAFLEAPGARGTEVVVEIVHDPIAGELGAAVEKVTGHDLATQLSDDLRRFKQQVETGSPIRSDAVLAGHRLADQLRQRAAQPPVEVPA
jgi:uncharacterized membrane protein